MRIGEALYVVRILSRRAGPRRHPVELGQSFSNEQSR